MEKSDESRTRGDGQRRKFSKIDKRAKDKMLGHLERMKEDRMPKKIFTQELEGTRRRRRPRKRRKGRRRSSSAGSEKMERVGGR